MAWRDSRHSRGRLALFTSSIILGVAALVAIDSFDYNLRNDIDTEAKSLLGADLELRSPKEMPDSVMTLLDSIGGVQASEASLGTMAFFPKTEDNKFVQLRTLDGGFPFYGRIETVPDSAADTYQQGPRALVDQNLMLQYQAKVGDSIRIGTRMFEIAGRLISVPGQNGMASTVSTPIFLPKRYLEETGLIKLGSRIQHKRYFYFPENNPDLDEWAEANKERLGRMRLRYDTVKTRQEDLDAAFGAMTNFLNLVGFVALLLGCVGVASAVEVYMREKINSVAIMRCLGVKGRDAFVIFMIQVGVMGFIGSIAGGIIGSILQRALPLVLADFLPVEASTAFSVNALLGGIVTGTLIAILFALLSLLRIRKVSPLVAIRAAYQSHRGRDPWRLVVMGAILLFVLGFSYIQVGEWIGALAFTVALGVSFLLLTGMGRLVMWAVRRFFPANAGYLWRQALANLYRPNNQTLILIISIGLGTGLITVLALMQTLLLTQLDLGQDDQTPNLLLIDVQSTQVDTLLDLADEYRLETMGATPIVTMRVSDFKGKTRSAWLADSTREFKRWVLDYEFRVTYRDTLMASEELLEGEWIGTTQADGINEAIPISVSKEFAEDDAKVAIGDEIIWDIQGLRLRTEVASIREIDFQQMQGAFVILFPEGVLEDAPQFNVLSFRSNGANQSANFQRAVAKNFPTLSVIDLRVFLGTAREILDKISFVIRFMALFSILTGLLVLAGSVIISRYQRMREGVLLRTLGASSRQVLTINFLEYLLLGILASMSGVILATIGAYLLAIFTFKISFIFDFQTMLLMPIGITILTVIIGLLNSRGALREPPLVVLRRELE